MKNIEQFSLYTAKIFSVLYEAFPVPVTLDRDKIIFEYIKFDKYDELKELNLKKGFSDIIKHSYREDLKK
jgi:hypothetical protein